MLQIGKILKSNGIDGGILVSFRDFDASELNLEEPVYIEFDGLPVPFFVQSIQPKGTMKAVLHLNDMSSLEDAEEVVGRFLCLEGEWEDSEEEDFIGWTVLDKGRGVGEVTGVEAIPGNPCIYVGEKLIPLHEDLVLRIDEKRRILDLDIPSGLI